MGRKRTSLAMVIVVTCAMGSAVGQQDEEVLSNADVVTLTEAGLSPSAIVTVIESRRTEFDTTVAQLAALSRVGVDSTVIEAMTRASAAARPPTSAPQTGAAAGSSSGSRPSSPAPKPGGTHTAPPAPTRQAGETFSDVLSSGGQGPEMVVIPAGRFGMGCVSGQECGDSERPVHDVMIPRAFAVSKYEVTFEDYDRFTYPNRVEDEGWGRGRRPVISVSWHDAQEYVAWLSRQTGQTYRLLSEAEWEYVARAGSSTAYSWGNNIGFNRANCRDWVGLSTCGDRWENTAPVGSFAANAFGVYDMHGNVHEWVEDCWHGSYSGAPTDSSAWQSGDCSQRVSRGGSWYLLSGSLRSAFRLSLTNDERDFSTGFRLARTFTP